MAVCSGSFTHKVKFNLFSIFVREIFDRIVCVNDNVVTYPPRPLKKPSYFCSSNMLISIIYLAEICLSLLSRLFFSYPPNQDRNETINTQYNIDIPILCLRPLP